MYPIAQETTQVFSVIGFISVKCVQRRICIIPKPSPRASLRSLIIKPVFIASLHEQNRLDSPSMDGVSSPEEGFGGLRPRTPPNVLQSETRTFYTFLMQRLHFLQQWASCFLPAETGYWTSSCRTGKWGKKSTDLLIFHFGARCSKWCGEGSGCGLLFVLRFPPEQRWKWFSFIFFNSCFQDVVINCRWPQTEEQTFRVYVFMCWLFLPHWES